MKRFTRWSHKPETSGSIPVFRNQTRVTLSALIKRGLGLTRGDRAYTALALESRYMGA